VSVRKLPAETPKASETIEAVKTEETIETSGTTKTSGTATGKLSLDSIIRSRDFTHLEVVNVQLFEFLLKIIHPYHLL
jgi:hypothetical protein